VLVGTDAAELRPEDGLVVRPDPGGEDGGDLRWHRCLRCDAWIPRPLPTEPDRQHIPERSEIEIPLRGRPLRDRYVLRLIALDRLVHVVILAVLAVVLFVVAGHEATLRADFDRIVGDLQSGGGAPVSSSGLLGTFRSLFRVTPLHLREAGAVVVAYGALEAAEMVGLWLGRRWAEYLTFVATTVLVPFEIYELARRFSVVKVITLILNLAIVLYLLIAKRLFGVRGGGRAERALREADMGWEALERATPWFVPATRTDDRSP
jgi:uncharacterized membrane protein (DUF2068 family)